MKIVVLTGAGISAESGIPTFRASDGLWAGYDINDVATYDAWRKDKELVLQFYNERRQNAKQAAPNKGHLLLAELEKKHEVTVITQNVDDLHERAGSSKVVHLHGSLFEARSTLDERLVYDIEGDILIGDKCEKGSQLRPNIVWFGEAVPMIEKAAEITEEADIFLIVGTSMLVYPAAGLIHSTKQETPIIVVDPNKPDIGGVLGIHFIEEKASTGMLKAIEIIDQLSKN
ncbi:SIR2 family NAD-dependent protein deacylase [Sediminitomix flava]|uniref:NAD-dependent protein deacylase n=1 Tax=Sediminitomix flava TaxID=379075 RepID=A0A315ZH40_SEDFL|nr:NAD-dependent deacylase [Sediminitomix flava]PWJ44450.1 NAD-dependent deacetylase [Sediminitomix flava]